MKRLLVLLFPIFALSWNCGNIIDTFCQNYACPPASSNFAVLNGATYSINNFNAVCFGNYNSSLPSYIGGRMLVSNNLEAQRFTIGNMTTLSDIPYSLVVGGDALWVEGELYPANAGLYVGRTLVAPATISIRRTGGPCINCAQTFEASRNYYTGLSSSFDAALPNADIYNAVIRCNSNTNVNVLDVDYLTFIAQYYGGIQASNSCLPNSYFIFNVLAPNFSDVSFGGTGFPTYRALYNIRGASTVTINGKVKGSILAPTSSIYQLGGQVYGNVVGGDCSLTSVSPCMNNIQDITTGITITPPVPSNTFTTGRYTGNSYTFTTGTQSQIPGTPNPNTPDFLPSGVCGAFFDTGCTTRTYTLGGTPVALSDYDVVSFNDMKTAVGSIKGNVAVQNNLEATKALTVGSGIQNSRNPMIVGNDAYWGSGSLLPAGNQMLIGGTFAGSPNVQNQTVPIKCYGDCVTSFFTIGQQCYQNISQQLLDVPPNVNAQLQSNRMVLNCSSSTDTIYVVNTTAEDFTRALWFDPQNCNPSARWVINIPGDDSVRFGAGSFPARPENVLYNIGGDRTVNVQTAVLGSILAPQCTINQVKINIFISDSQNGGVIVGKVVAGDIPQLTQVNSLLCTPNSQLLEEMYNTATTLAIGAISFLIFPVMFSIFRFF